MLEGLQGALCRTFVLCCSSMPCWWPSGTHTPHVLVTTSQSLCSGKGLSSLGHSILRRWLKEVPSGVCFLPDVSRCRLFLSLCRGLVLSDLPPTSFQSRRCFYFPSFMKAEQRVTQLLARPLQFVSFLTSEGFPLLLRPLFSPFAGSLSSTSMLSVVCPPLYPGLVSSLSVFIV